MEINGYPNYLIYKDGRVFSKKRNIFLTLIETDRTMMYLIFAGQQD